MQRIEIEEKLKYQLTINYIKNKPYKVSPIEISFEYFDSINFHKIQVFRYQSQEHVFPIYCPITINQFMIERKFQISDFQHKWKDKSFIKLKTEEINNNPLLLKSGKDYKKYFHFIINMNVSLDYDLIQEKGDYKFALWANINKDEFLMKILSKPTNRSSFSIKTRKENYNMAVFILNNFLFLFKN